MILHQYKPYFFIIKTILNMSHSVILIPGVPSVEVLEIFNTRNITYIDQLELRESASDKSFNDSKYFGTICSLIAQNKTIALSNATQLLTKKGSIMLAYYFTTRIPNVVPEDFKYFVVGTSGVKISDDKKFNTWAEKGATYLTPEQLSTQEFKSTTNTFFATCGFLTSHIQNNAEVTGHCTRGYGVSYEDALALRLKYADSIKKDFSGDIYEITANGLKGGTIISIPSLDNLAHITNNTIIKSSLSGPVLAKFNANIFEFPLQDIDPTSKQNPIIKISKIGETSIITTGWYEYAVEFTPK